jgi:hypothetical protein
MDTPEEAILRQRNLAQIREAFSPSNRWFTTEGLGREPTDQELVLWFIERGGSKDFAKDEKTTPTTTQTNLCPPCGP